MRHHNTWLGDPVRALLALNQNKLIKRDNLMENVVSTAAQLRQGLEEISSDYPQWVQDVRGMGTCLAFSTEEEAMRPTLLSALKANGVYQNFCGPTGIRLRPNLYFTERHATMYLDILRNTVKSL
jgi:4-aminobutyrate aminotransferase-like enzyme